MYFINNYSNLHFSEIFIYESHLSPYEYKLIFINISLSIGVNSK
jgi:hypothetical protein